MNPLHRAPLPSCSIFGHPFFFFKSCQNAPESLKTCLWRKKKSPHILCIKAHIGNLCMYVAGYFCIPTPPKRFDWSSPNLLWRSNYLMLWNWWRRRSRPRPVVGVAAHKEAADAARTRWRCSGVLSTLWRGRGGGPGLTFWRRGRRFKKIYGFLFFEALNLINISKYVFLLWAERSDRAPSHV